MWYVMGSVVAFARVLYHILERGPMHSRSMQITRMAGLGLRPEGKGISVTEVWEWHLVKLVCAVQN